MRTRVAVSCWTRLIQHGALGCLTDQALSARPASAQGGAPVQFASSSAVRPCEGALSRAPAKNTAQLEHAVVPLAICDGAQTFDREFGFLSAARRRKMGETRPKRLPRYSAIAVMSGAQPHLAAHLCRPSLVVSSTDYPVGSNIIFMDGEPIAGNPDQATHSNRKSSTAIWLVDSLLPLHAVHIRLLALCGISPVLPLISWACLIGIAPIFFSAFSISTYSPHFPIIIGWGLF